MFFSLFPIKRRIREDLWMVC